MLVESQIVSRGSGSIGGVVWSHNRGGQYLRSRVTPVNPNTVFQQVVRSLVSALASLWTDGLTQLQRDAWDSYGAGVPVRNRMGNMITLTGLNMYVRSNVPIQQAGFARQDEAPTIFNLGDYTLPSIGAFATTQDVTIGFTDTDDWVNEDDAAMLFYFSRPKNTSIQYFKGPYRLAGSIDGDATTAPTSPATVSVPFPIFEGQKLFGRVQVIRADGRLSADARLETGVGP